MDHGLHGREGVQLSGIVRLRLSRLCGPAPVGRHFGRVAKLDHHLSIAGPPACDRRRVLVSPASSSSVLIWILIAGVMIFFDCFRHIHVGVAYNLLQVLVWWEHGASFAKGPLLV